MFAFPVRALSLTAKLMYRSGDAATSESHKNEGFLKSIWHNLTNHPAHRKPESDEQTDSASKSEDSEKKKD